MIEVDCSILMSLPIAIFGIENDGVNLAINLLILFLVVVYLALIYWTYSDARRRIADPMLVGCAAAAAAAQPMSIGSAIRRRASAYVQYASAR